MAFDIREIKEASKKDWRKEWTETASLIPEKTAKDYTAGAGAAHMLHELVQKTRQAFLKAGFTEIENPVYISEEDVYKQYGPEAPVILDRVYYLAGLPRPDIGLGEKKIGEVKSVNSSISPDELKKIFREYREGLIEGDNMVEELTKRLNLSTDEASSVIDLFPEFKGIKPVASTLTLRSHMTGAWFPTLSAMKDHKMPLKLFSVGLRFRREQKVNSTHLRAHYGGSMVIMDDDISLEAGKKASEKILENLGYKNIEFTKKKTTSNYYAPDTEYEVYAGGIEIADIGMYSPVALANYDIPHNVFNLGFGLERMLMVKYNIKDIREVIYPQFHQITELSDKELAGKVTIDKKPASHEGQKLAEAIKKTALEHGSEKSPCTYKAYEGMLAGKKIIVNVVEKEANTQLLGPAALNDIYIHESGIYGLPKDTSKLKTDVSEILKNGLKLDINFLDAIADYFAAGIEEELKAGKTEGYIAVKMAKTAGDVNIAIDSAARRFILSKNKPISIKGPVFTAVEYKVE
ncbi:MAG: O-phosphoserine--tRNA ligase [Candidatus Altiarchaeota archaeon]|nr:O-phosphoserine--tRNA ligase [Candidatus Altiarchaeota archaeon]